LLNHPGDQVAPLITWGSVVQHHIVAALLTETRMGQILLAALGAKDLAAHAGQAITATL
jgi:hypothetical protein